MKREIITSTVVVSFINMLRALLGIASQMVIAFYFGTSQQLDIYFIVFALPSVVMGVMLALFGSSIIPDLIHVKDKSEELESAVSSIFFYTFVLFLVISFAGILFGEKIIRLTTSLPTKDISIAYRIAILMWGIVGVKIINSCFISFYHLHKRFMFPATTSLFPVIGMIGGAVFLSRRVGVLGLVIGWLCMDILSCLLLSRVLFKYHNFSIKKIRLLNRHALFFLRCFVPTAISILPFTILPFIDAYWVSGLDEGSMSYIGYSSRIVIALASLITTGVCTVILPYLSENVKNNQTKLFFGNISSSMKGVLFFLIPVACFCFAYREPFLRVFLQRGEFNDASVKAIADLLPFYFFGMIAMCLSTLVNRAYFARKLFKRLSVVSLILMAFYFLMAGYFSHRFSYIGIGIAYVIYWLCFFFTTTILLNKAIFSSDFLLYTAKVAMNSFAAVGISYCFYSQVKLLSSFGNILLCFIITLVILYVMNRYVLKTVKALSLQKLIGAATKYLSYVRQQNL